MSDCLCVINEFVINDRGDAIAEPRVIRVYIGLYLIVY